MATDTNTIRLEDLENGAVSFVKNADAMPSGVYVVKNATSQVVQTAERKLTMADLEFAKIPFEVELPPARKTDAEVHDEQFAGHNVGYQVVCLTKWGEHAGTVGPFYIQFEGDLATTGLHSFYPYVDPCHWNMIGFVDKYVGRINKIRIAPGTGNGWGLYEFIVFYPRETLRLHPDTWIDSDGPNILQMSL